jgi:hypothetical protein
MFDHVSVLSTLTRRFKLPPLNDRVANTRDLSLCLDPAIGRIASAPQLDPVEVSLSGLHDRVVRGEHHEEMAASADARLIPKHLDRRGESLDITKRVLDYGKQLGAVRLVY